MVVSDAIISTLVKSAVIGRLVEKKIMEKVPQIVEDKLKDIDHKIREKVKRELLDLLDDYSVKDKIKRIIR